MVLNIENNKILQNNREGKLMTTQDTEQLLRDALSRLLAGNPINTKKDGKISPNRINQEAGLTLSTIYYSKYEAFLKGAKLDIKAYNDEKAQGNLEEEFDAEEVKINKLRAELKNEKKLKDKYRNGLNDQKLLNDEVVIENASLAFRLFELSDQQRNNGAGSNVFPF